MPVLIMYPASSDKKDETSIKELETRFTDVSPIDASFYQDIVKKTIDTMG